MQCSEPGAIRDEELLAYLDGVQVRPEVAQHLSLCPRCVAQLGTYQQLERSLTQTLYRWDCPTNLTLGEYYLDVLSDEEAAAIQSHLRACVLCTAEMHTLEVFLADDPPVARPVVRVPERYSTRVLSGPLYPLANTHQQSAQRLFEKDLRTPDALNISIKRIHALLLPLQPRLAWQRDPSGLLEQWPRNYVAEDVHVALQIELAPHQQAIWQLLGLVTHQSLALEALQGIPVQLLVGEQVIHTQYIDDLGNFVFSALSPATYTLALQLPDRVIMVDQLPILLDEE